MFSYVGVILPAPIISSPFLFMATNEIVDPVQIIEGGQRGPQGEYLGGGTYKWQPVDPRRQVAQLLGGAKSDSNTDEKDAFDVKEKLTPDA